ncbi:hypothetical protein M378DRAFT_532189 [Amanita muscaria Koide BX008]|uniref:C2H2-type domain-containing protein n=1 Tax=Amanita muscaria (strain Koide BX008) TaxID=946122 RepID=A0A0C2WHW3_AMAMK|nr:hypothetical protein M378DRAFT_532189 [Amanita muscaria Koide BX008]
MATQRPMDVSSPTIMNRTPLRAYHVDSQAGSSRPPSAHDGAPRQYASSSALPQNPHTLRSPVSMHVTPPRDPRSRSFDADTKSPLLHTIRAAPEPGHHQGRTDPLHYSFNVLRSDPSNSSLEHIASSASYPHKSSNNPLQAHSNLHLGGAGTVAPAFRVTVPPSSSPSHYDMSSSPGDRHMQGVERTSSRRGSESSQVYTTISFPLDEGPRGPSSMSSPSGRAGESRVSDVNGAASDDGEPPHAGGTAGKKHICPTCSKRFNRPSSLRIHVNTHTGATPFRCPFPNCGREFNVNSNMRRHYRNHTSPGLSRAQPVEPRRRRRRAHDPDLVFVTGGPPGQPHPYNDLDYHGPHQDFMHHVPGTPESSLSDESDDDQNHQSGYHRYNDDYHHYRHLPVSRSHAPYAFHARSRSENEDGQVVFPSRESHLRSSTPMSIVSSPSQSDPDSRPGTPNSCFDHKYSPSVPFLRSVLVADSSVSTALRPAFTNGHT